MKSRYLTDSEIMALRRLITEAEWLPFRISYETGLRIGDVLKIRVHDLTDDGINYCAQKTKKTGFARIQSGTLSALLKNAQGTEWCFPSSKKAGAHLTRQAAWARLKKTARLAGVEVDGVSPHSLRKVFAVELFKRSDLDAVRGALQHSDERTTELYALSDFTTSEYADKPLLRGDLQIICEKVAEIVIARLESQKKL